MCRCADVQICHAVVASSTGFWISARRIIGWTVGFGCCFVPLPTAVCMYVPYLVVPQKKFYSIQSAERVQYHTEHFAFAFADWGGGKEGAGPDVKFESSVATSWQFPHVSTPQIDQSPPVQSSPVLRLLLRAPLPSPSLHLPPPLSPHARVHARVCVCVRACVYICVRVYTGTVHPRVAVCPGIGNTGLGNP